jgi:hypothetical protein
MLPLHPTAFSGLSAHRVASRRKMPHPTMWGVSLAPLKSYRQCLTSYLDDGNRFHACPSSVACFHCTESHFPAISARFKLGEGTMLHRFSWRFSSTPPQPTLPHLLTPPPHPFPLPHSPSPATVSSTRPQLRIIEEGRSSICWFNALSPTLLLLSSTRMAAVTAAAVAAAS